MGSKGGKGTFEQTDVDVKDRTETNKKQQVDESDEGKPLSIGEKEINEQQQTHEIDVGKLLEKSKRKKEKRQAAFERMKYGKGKGKKEDESKSGELDKDKDKGSANDAVKIAAKLAKEAERVKELEDIEK